MTLSKRIEKIKISFNLQLHNQQGFLTAGAGKTGLRRTRSKKDEL